MSFDVEQCKRDGWKCEYQTPDGRWIPAIVLAQPASGNEYGISAEGHALLWCPPIYLRNLPPKPKEPTRVAIWVQNNGGNANTWGNSFDTQTDFRAQPFGYIRIELPWPWNESHQKWMDRFDKVGDHSWCRLWTLIEEGWYVQRDEAAYYIMRGGHSPVTGPTLTAAVEAAWKMRRAAAPAK